MIHTGHQSLSPVEEGQVLQVFHQVPFGSSGHWNSLITNSPTSVQIPSWNQNNLVFLAPPALQNGQLCFPNQILTREQRINLYNYRCTLMQSILWHSDNLKKLLHSRPEDRFIHDAIPSLIEIFVYNRNYVDNLLQLDNLSLQRNFGILGNDSKSTTNEGDYGFGSPHNLI